MGKVNTFAEAMKDNGYGHLLFFQNMMHLIICADAVYDNGLAKLLRERELSTEPMHLQGHRRRTDPVETTLTDGQHLWAYRSCLQQLEILQGLIHIHVSGMHPHRHRRVVLSMIEP